MTPALTLPARGTRLEEGGGLLQADAMLAACVALFLPLAMLAAGLAGPLRLLYPAMAVAAAGYLYFRNSPWYVGLLVWLFCASPLIRRMVDLPLGFQQSSPILLAPYAAALFCAISFMTYLLRPRARLIGPFVVFLVCVGYGWVLAAFAGRLASGMVDVLKWGIGPLVAVHLMAQAQQYPAFHRVVLNSFGIACPAMAAYGIMQFIEPTPWDADWVSNMILQGMTSMGQPLPFELRVFGTMHSPGSFGAFLMVGLILLIGRPLPLALPGMALTVLGLALAQYRAIWTGTAIGVLLVLFGGTARERMRIIIGGMVLVLAMGPMIAVPEMQETITKRIESLTTLAADESGEDRLNQYREFLEGEDRLIIGEGLAITGASRQMDGKQGVVIDSGIIEVYTALGIIMATVMFAAMAVLVLRTFRASDAVSPHMHLYRAVVVASFLQLPFGSVHVGEAGFGAWLCLGLAMASMLPRSDIRRTT